VSEVRVLIYHATGDADGVLDAYHQVSKEMAGVPGLLGNELLHGVHQPDRFIVLSRWASLDAFNTWEQGREHKGSTEPLRQYRDTSMARPFGVYAVTAQY
jgi:heme-degrading monooxygenase HmoA